jgi:2-polyprenyl-3-methyl-5-hydroxy-6-metoxy-1,4-benzoquinol methylase
MSNLAQVDNLRKQIFEANVKVHQFEAKCYELIHDEIYGRYEQKRIDSVLKRIDKLIVNNKKRALDFGAGTGNITGKLLRLGYTVTAVDISSDMCEVLKRQFKDYVKENKLKVVNSSIEEAGFEGQQFDLITCYSVLHHLPDYLAVIQKLSTILRKGGIMYLDHESITYTNRPSKIQRLASLVHFTTNSMLNRLFLKIKGVNIPSIKHLDYSLSDYWAFDEHATDHDKIGQIFQKQKYTSKLRINYHLNRTWIFSPTFYLYKYMARPDYSLWIATK